MFKKGEVIDADLNIVSEYTEGKKEIVELEGSFRAEFRRYQRLEFGCKLKLRRTSGEGEIWHLDQFESVSHKDFGDGMQVGLDIRSQSRFNQMLMVLDILR
jgi:hypothetical protein